MVTAVQMRRWLGVVIMVSACGGAPVVSPAGSGAQGFGHDGRLATRVEHTRLPLGPHTRAATLVWPLLHAGDPGSLPERVPAVVLVQGGLVQRDRYLWLARHLASRGAAVALPEHATWMAFFDPGVARAAADDLVEKLGHRWRGLVLGGHSLGGVMAVKTALADARVDGLFLLASEPDSRDDVESWRTPVLSIAGGKDESQSVERSRSGWERFGGERWLAVVADLTHFAWTEPGHDPTVWREREAPSPDLAGARFGGLYALDAFLAHVVDRDPAAAQALAGAAATPAGVALTRASAR